MPPDLTVFGRIRQEKRLVSLDRTGSVAVAKVAVRYQGRRYTDYLTLQEATMGWRIVGKAFFSLD